MELRRGVPLRDVDVILEQDACTESEHPATAQMDEDAQCSDGDERTDREPCQPVEPRFKLRLASHDPQRLVPRERLTAQECSRHRSRREERSRPSARNPSSAAACPEMARTDSA